MVDTFANLGQLPAHGFIVATPAGTELIEQVISAELRVVQLNRIVWVRTTRAGGAHTVCC